MNGKLTVSTLNAALCYQGDSAFQHAALWQGGRAPPWHTSLVGKRIKEPSYIKCYIERAFLIDTQLLSTACALVRMRWSLAGGSCCTQRNQR